MVKNVTVLGAGTAGMLSALWAKKFLVGSKVTVVENSKKGIVGVGEATIPTLQHFLEMLDIDPLHMLSKVGGTIKNGINFENWNGDGDKYLHDFFYTGDLDRVLSESKTLPFNVGGCGLEFYQKESINTGIKFKDYMYQPRTSYQNKVDFDNMRYAYHFNTNKVSKYLKTIALERGIEVIDDNFVSADKDKVGNIEKINLEKYTIKTDFVFDCSGFARLIIGGVYNQKWISYKETLPMKCAIPFFLENEEEIKPYTSAIAMKNGWMWQIPLQDRIGAGYVFDSDYITPEEAKQEVEEYLGHKIIVNKVIPFDAGRFENVWVNNCIALGLSSNFIEPLESTSIAMTTSALDLLSLFINNMNSKKHSTNIDNFNKLMSDSFDIIKDFVYLHYLTKRDDSKFWIEFLDKNPIPKELKSKLELLSNNDLKEVNIEQKFGRIWDLRSYMIIAEGLGLVNKGNNIGYDNLSPSLNELERIFKTKEGRPHKEVLKEINEFYKEK